MSIYETVREIVTVAHELGDVCVDEEHGAAWGRRSEMPAVSGGGTSDPTSAGVGVPGRFRSAETVSQTLEDVLARLRRELLRQRPQRTGECRTSGCEGVGLSTFDGRCDQCSTFWRRNGYAPDPRLVKDWNARRPRPCACSTACCPDGCVRMCGPGERTAQACRKRQQRARQEAS